MKQKILVMEYSAINADLVNKLKGKEFEDGFKLCALADEINARILSIPTFIELLNKEIHKMNNFVFSYVTILK